MRRISPRGKVLRSWNIERDKFKVLTCEYEQFETFFIFNQAKFTLLEYNSQNNRSIHCLSLIIIVYHIPVKKLFYILTWCNYDTTASNWAVLSMWFFCLFFFFLPCYQRHLVWKIPGSVLSSSVRLQDSCLLCLYGFLWRMWAFTYLT